MVPTNPVFAPTLGGASRSPWNGYPLPRADGRLLLYAHRGASAWVTENTRGAFDRGYDDGADGAETDVQLTADGVPVLFHDETTGRIARDGTHLRISETPWSTLQSLVLRGDTRILTLEALLSDFAKRYPGWRLNLELKTDLDGPDAEQTWLRTASRCRDMGRQIARQVEGHPELWPLVNFSSFNPHALAGLRDVNQQMPAALLHEEGCNFMYREQTLAQVANALGVQGINVHFTSVVSGEYDPRAMEALGFPTCCYTVDDEDLARGLAERGCAGIFTNDPRAMGARTRRPAVPVDGS